MRSVLIFLSTFLVSLSYSETYTYDDNGRLTQVAYDDGSGILYTYDANGNRLSAIVFMTEDVSIVIQTIGQEGNLAFYEVSFDASASAEYRFEGNTSLSASSWTAYPYALAQNGTESTDPITNANGETAIYFTIDTAAHPKFLRIVAVGE